MNYKELVGNNILVLVTVCLLNSTTSQLLRANKIPLAEEKKKKKERKEKKRKEKKRKEKKRKEKKRKEKKRKEKKRKEKKRKENGKPNKTE
jgi:hemolysin activation/secretion protein